jgi:hypothetical protein
MRRVLAILWLLVPAWPAAVGAEEHAVRSEAR